MKRLFTGLFFTQALNLLIKPVWILFIDLEVQNQLSKVAYGEYFATLHLSLLFVILLDPGLHNFVIKEVAAKSNKASAYLNSSIRLKLILSVFYLVSLSTAAFVFQYETTQFLLLFLLGIFQVGVSMIQYGRAFLTSFQQFKWDGLFSVGDRIISISLVAALLWGGISGFSLNVFRFAGAQTLAAFIALIALGFVIYKVIPRTHSDEPQISITAIVKSSWPFALLTVLMGFYTYMDSQMLKMISVNGLEDVSDYAMAYRPYFAVLMFAQVFALYLMPIMSKAAANKESYAKLAHHAFSILFYGVLLLAFIVFLYSDLLSDLMYSERGVHLIAKAMSMLMFGLIANAFTFVYGTALTAEGNLKVLNVLAFLSVMINLGLNYFLIPEHGIIGAAIATLMAQSFFGLACYFTSIQKGYVKFEGRWWLKWVIVASVLVWISFGIQQLGLLWYQNVIALIIISLGLVLGVRLIHFKDIKADFIDKSKV